MSVTDRKFNGIVVQDTNFTVQDNADITKQLKFELSGITTGVTRTLTVPNNNGAIVVGSGTLIAHGVVIGGGVGGTVSTIATIGSSGAIFQSTGGTTDPAFSTATYPSTTTANRILYSSATNTVSQLTSAATSALITDSSSVPSFTSGSTANRLLRTDGTSVTFSQAVLTTDVTGTLPVSNGGTGATTLTVHGVVIGNGTSGVSVTAAGSSGQVLQSAGASADPVYSTATYPSTTTANRILYSNATNTISEITSANTSALVTNSSGVPSFTSGTTANRLLRTDGSAITFAQASLTTDVSGTLPIANGGTNGVTSSAGFDNLAPTTTKGDLIARSSTSNIRVAVGTDGQFLKSDSTSTSGVSWVTPISDRNYLINGDFFFWQRNTSFTTTGSGYTYNADRWKGTLGSGSGQTVSRQSLSADTSLFCLRFQRDNGSSNTNGSVLQSVLESNSITNLRGKSVTVSFRMRKGSGFTPSTMTISLSSGTGTDQADGNSFTGQSTVGSVAIANATLTTSFQTFSFTTTTTLATTVNQLAIIVSSSSYVGTAGASDYYEISQVMMNEGTLALPFKLAGFNIQDELLNCQRYYEKTYNLATNPGTSSTSIGQITGIRSAGTNNITGYMKVRKRTAPTVVIYSPATGTSGQRRNLNAGADDPSTASNIGEMNFDIGGSASVSDGLTAHFTADAEL